MYQELCDCMFNTIKLSCNRNLDSMPEDIDIEDTQPGEEFTWNDGI